MAAELVGGKVRLEEAPLIERRVKFEGGEAVVLVPPRIEDWRTAYGMTGQKVELPGCSLSINYLAGAAREKEGSADTGQIAAAILMARYLLVVAQMEDYLSPPRDKDGKPVDDGWTATAQKMQQAALVRDNGAEIRWGRSDVAGADLQRSLALQVEKTGKYFGENEFQISRVKNPAWCENIYGAETFPVMEKVVESAMAEWLIGRNQERYWAIRHLGGYGEGWKHYQMNSVFGVQAMLIDLKSFSYYREIGVGAAGMMKSNADVQQGTNERVLVENPYSKRVSAFSGYGGLGNPSHGDVNFLVDRHSFRAGEAGEEGLTDANWYSDKAAPDGLYMTWGPVVYKEVDWENFAFARADRPKVFSSAIHEGKAILYQATDGEYGDKRFGREDYQKLMKNFCGRTGQLLREGPAAVIGKIVKRNDAKSPRDDYLAWTIGVQCDMALRQYRVV